MSESPSPNHWNWRSEAENKAAALHNVGWERGSGAEVWACGVRDVLDLHAAARGALAADGCDRSAWLRLHSSAFLLVISIYQVVAFARQVWKLTDDDELATACEGFDAACRG